MLSLFILLLERVGLIILIAYLLMNVPYFKKVMTKREKGATQLQLLLIFGLFAVISNFTGVEIKNNQIISSEIFYKLSDDTSLANTRILIISVAGLVGGPYVGIGGGVISGLSRYFMGGEAAYTYIISSVVVGIIAGYVGHRSLRENRYPTIVQGVIIGAVLEMIQMLCIILFSPDKASSFELVQFIALPMISINSLGSAIFLSIILSTLQQEERMRAVQTHDVLAVANQTLPYFRAGLTQESATEAAAIIKDLLKLSAVSITNKTDILAHVGAGSDHHVPQKKIITDLSKDVIRLGEVKEAHSKEEIGCTHPNCPLDGAIVIPLYAENQIAGTLKFYFTDNRKMTYVERQLAEGLGNIFSSQIELGRAELQSKLLKEAEIKSLQAQVNPHFFFNAINTISALVRVDSERARELLLSLSHFFRSNLQGARTPTITVEKELQQVQAYLALEQARFPDRFNIHFEVEDNCLQEYVPPFLIQILVENAIKHAFSNRKKGNDIDVRVRKAHCLYIEVKDNGFGISADKRKLIGQSLVHSESGTGSALENLNRRLTGLFGEKAQLQFETAVTGTRFYAELPLKGGQ